MPVSVYTVNTCSSQFIIAAYRSIVDCSSDNSIPYSART